MHGQDTLMLQPVHRLLEYHNHQLLQWLLFSKNFIKMFQLLLSLICCSLRFCFMFITDF
jgi:hypothetical protein